MSKIVEISLAEFGLLVKFAQDYHQKENEPIPEFTPASHLAIKSCLQQPFQTFGKKHLYRGFERKAAILFYLLCKNHPLPNGNKRMACFTLAYFGIINGRQMIVSPEELYKLAKTVTISDPEVMDQAVGLLTNMNKDIFRTKK